MGKIDWAWNKFSVVHGISGMLVFSNNLASVCESSWSLNVMLGLTIAMSKTLSKNFFPFLLSLRILRRLKNRLAAVEAIPVPCSISKVNSIRAKKQWAKGIFDKRVVFIKTRTKVLLLTWKNMNADRSMWHIKRLCGSSTVSESVRKDRTRIDTRKKRIIAYEAMGMKEMLVAQEKAFLSLEESKTSQQALGTTSK